MIAAFILAAAVARAAPFGIPMGTRTSRLSVQAKYGNKYFIVKPPTPNKIFVGYTVVATPIHGTCSILVNTEQLQTSEQAKKKLREITKLLSVYGRPKVGEMPPGSIMLTTSASELVLVSEQLWEGPLPNNLRSISAEIETSGEKFSVAVRYRYRNAPECYNWEPNQDRSGL